MVMSSRPSLNTPHITLSAKHLRAGDVVAYPTEAVWGLGCDPFNELAVDKILQLKAREPDKGVILIASDIKQFHFLLKDLDWSARERLYATWPGPNTWLVPHNNLVPDIITGKHSTVALRVSAHPVVQHLCRAFGGPIVSTSANPAGLSAAKNATKIRQYFKRAPYPVFICKGVVGGNNSPSTIRDLATGKVLRG